MKSDLFLTCYHVPITSLPFKFIPFQPINLFTPASSLHFLSLTTISVFNYPLYVFLFKLLFLILTFVRGKSTSAQITNILFNINPISLILHFSVLPFDSSKYKVDRYSHFPSKSTAFGAFLCASFQYFITCHFTGKYSAHFRSHKDQNPDHQLVYALQIPFSFFQNEA